ncbi:MAG: TIGR04348 family glycosyltransferase [Candidatus Latescibacteria bacterium]|nr:TIGR04348 family glycosyltransferase [Candidatus Latescibacterota bacterium]
MKIVLATPAPPRSRKGNRITALRWAKFLRQLDHRVDVVEEYRTQRCDLLVALHARRSFPSIERYRRQYPDSPLVLALTGTDLYGDIHTDAQAQQALTLADRFVVLQTEGIAQLPEPLRPKARVIYQSLRPPAGTFKPRQDQFEVCVLGHMRPVKDPFRTAEAAHLLPASSRLHITHIGGALSAAMATRARTEEQSNPRYRWLGELPRWQALRRLAQSRLLVLTSIMEGGANAVSEALACNIPVISTHISGSIGLLGSGYPGYFPVGDVPVLARLLTRAETDAAFYNTLKTHCRHRAPLVDPARERASWAELLEEFSAS